MAKAQSHRLANRTSHTPHGSQIQRSPRGDRINSMRPKCLGRDVTSSCLRLCACMHLRLYGFYTRTATHCSCFTQASGQATKLPHRPANMQPMRRPVDRCRYTLVLSSRCVHGFEEVSARRSIRTTVYKMLVAPLRCPSYTAIKSVPIIYFFPCQVNSVRCTFQKF